MKIDEKDLIFVKGTVKFNEPMNRHTTFKIGGPADAWVSPSDEDDLLEILRWASEKKKNIFLIGGGSKLLIGDKGIRGLVISLDSPAFNGFYRDGSFITAGSGMKIQELLKKASGEDLGGLEFLAGIPGSLGGALIMNAGWPSKATGDFVEGITAIKDLKKVRLDKSDIKFSYRSSNLEGFIILSAKFKLEKKAKDQIESEIKRNLEKKRKTQELGYPSAGSIFLNPSGAFPAWELIEKSGLRGKSVGDAAVSGRHANFIINRGKASAADVAELIEKIQKKVFKDCQIMLKLEVKFIGEF